MTVDKLLLKILNGMPECFAPTECFALPYRGSVRKKNAVEYWCVTARNNTLRISDLGETIPAIIYLFDFANKLNPIDAFPAKLV
jgi:hypothetical protein